MILVLGNACVDRVYPVPHVPVSGETLLAGRLREDLGGKGLNQAVVAKRAGADVRFVAAIGRDAAGARIAAQVTAEGLDAADLLSRDLATDESLILVADDGGNCIVSTSAAAASVSPEDARRAAARLTAADSLVLQGNLTRETTAAALQAARARGATTLLNAAPIAFDYAGIWPLVDVAVLNAVEAATLGCSDHPDTAAEALRRQGAGTVVVTLGAAGALAFAPDGRHPAPAPEVVAVDTTGAGDTFCGVLAAALDRGLPLPTALRWAVDSAAVTVTRAGTGDAFPSATELAALRPAQG